MRWLKAIPGFTIHGDHWTPPISMQTDAHPLLIRSLSGCEGFPSFSHEHLRIRANPWTTSALRSAGEVALHAQR